ncbi:isoprenylcysteine carboxylmethyltransferase family protein [Mucilaginibacter corticis]|uniref:Isoprenylcysteine carboxylmethyltransferase family protein n=1 Tax=Mucilaginibacter corticis TaxID=2597670 RepID=A0A556MHD9_9SPHI|nr:isoprenylcysteine carboxylmethyltransferase family protein [Mucilaginibacter corticis]TSJ39289.1 isoprenylcysteine carboxylmethyltransferase family protein [Mucilaginibacter corticis]
MHISYYQIAEIFGLSEIILLLVKRSRKGSSKNQADNRSLIYLWIAITGCIALGGYIAIIGIWPFPDARLVMDIGLAVAIIGFIIRWTAILQLGKMFTVDVAISSQHKLKTTGLYKIVRHPSYLGLMMIICSIALCQASILSCIVVIIPTFIALIYRIQVEEKALIIEFGADYIQYTKTTARLIPGIY